MQHPISVSLVKGPRASLSNPPPIENGLLGMGMGMGMGSGTAVRGYVEKRGVPITFGTLPTYAYSTDVTTEDPWASSQGTASVWICPSTAGCHEILSSETRRRSRNLNLDSKSQDSFSAERRAKTHPSSGQRGYVPSFVSCQQISVRGGMWRLGMKHGHGFQGYAKPAEGQGGR